VARGNTFPQRFYAGPTAELGGGGQLSPSTVKAKPPLRMTAKMIKRVEMEKTTIQGERREDEALYLPAHPSHREVCSTHE